MKKKPNSFYETKLEQQTIWDNKKKNYSRKVSHTCVHFDLGWVSN